MACKSLTQDYIKSLFTYKDGNLYWKVARSNCLKIGQIAGSGKKYKVVNLDSSIKAVHVLIWIYHYGTPTNKIDHINGNSLDNRIENLRQVTVSQNGLNRSKQANNTSGYKNVSWFKPKQKWRVRINLMQKEIHIGYFDDIELADLVATEARSKYHKGYARHN